MYYRNFRPAEKRNENDIPVQYFADSFSADAFTNKESKIKEEKSVENDDNCEQEIENKKDAAKKADREVKGILGSKDVDSLLLIGLIFLFLTDCECKEDILIPVLLGVLLLS